MNNQFFEKPILNSPYAYPIRHWELDEVGQPTQKIIETRRRAEFITPIGAHGAIGRGISRRRDCCHTVATIGLEPRHERAHKRLNGLTVIKEAMKT